MYSYKIIDENKMNELHEESLSVLSSISAEQTQEIETEKPHYKFLFAFRELLTMRFTMLS